MDLKYTIWIASYLGRVGSPRGRCIMACDEMQAVFPELVEVRGWYRRNEHCWLKAPSGTVVDPTVSQFKRKSQIESQIDPTQYIPWKHCRRGDKSRIGRRPKPCTRCGLVDRRPGDGCRACNSAKMARFRANNHESCLAKEREYAKKKKADVAVVTRKKAYAKDWYQANREKRIAQEANRRKNNPSVVERQRERDAKRRANPTFRQMSTEYQKQYRSQNGEYLTVRNRERLFGISETDQKSKLLEQGGKCAACGNELKQGKKEVHLDHDHSNGLVRGFVHRRCNIAIGLMFDSPAIARHIAEYLERWGRK